MQTNRTSRCDRRTRTRFSGRGAFTLVEMLITISVIIFLVGLTITAGSALMQRSEVRQTENTLRLLDMAVQEWETSADRKLSWGDDKDQYDIWSERAYILVITELLEVIRKNERVETMLARIAPEHIYTYEQGVYPRWFTYYEPQLAEFVGAITILDPWGIPIYATHPGALFDREATPLAQPDSDGTERTLNEQDFGIARNRRVCFVSAGPDMRFGLDQEFPGMSGDELESAKKKAREDNVYSYEPDDPA